MKPRRSRADRRIAARCAYFEASTASQTAKHAYDRAAHRLGDSEASRVFLFSRDVILAILESEERRARARWRHMERTLRLRPIRVALP